MRFTSSWERTAGVNCFSLRVDISAAGLDGMMLSDLSHLKNALIECSLRLRVELDMRELLSPLTLSF